MYVCMYAGELVDVIPCDVALPNRNRRILPDPTQHLRHHRPLVLVRTRKKMCALPYRHHHTTISATSML